MWVVNFYRSHGPMHMHNDHFTKKEVEIEVELVEEKNPITSHMEEWESKLQMA